MVIKANPAELFDVRVAVLVNVVPREEVEWLFYLAGSIFPPCHKIEANKCSIKGNMSRASINVF